MIRRSCKQFITKSLKRSLSTTSEGQKAQISKLSNGVRVISDNIPGHFAAVGVYLKAGSRYENDSLSGVAHLLDRMAFQSTENLTSTEIQSEVEKLGGNVMAHTSREVFQIQATCYHADLDRILPLFSELMLRPKYSFEELESQRQSTQYEILDFQNNPELYLPELLHEVAYGKTTLGRSTLCNLENLEKVIGVDLHKFHSALLKPENLVIAGSGMEHSKLIDLAQTYFGKFEANITTNPPNKLTQLASKLLPQLTFEPDFSNATYKGGLQLQPDDNAMFNQVMVGLPSVAVTDPDIYPLAVLQALLGGGGSFSAGGPGKGMHSRLYRTVLNQYAWAHSCQAFHHSYTDSGIIGIGGACPADFSLDLLQVIGFTLASVADRRRIGHQELDRAKFQLKHNLLMNLESSLVRVEDMGQQLVSTDHYVNPTTATKNVDLVSQKSLADTVAKHLLNPKITPTVLAYGKSLEPMQNSQQILNRFGIGTN